MKFAFDRGSSVECKLSFLIPSTIIIAMMYYLPVVMLVLVLPNLKCINLQ